MRQHSEAYIRAMRNLRRRKLTRKLLAAILAVTITFAGCKTLFTFINTKSQEVQEVQAVSGTSNQPLVTGGIATVFTRVAELPEEYTLVDPFSEEEAYLLAKLAMAEAEGEDTIGKALVIRTVLNRVESDNAYFPDTISEVIFQNKAFTPTQNGRYAAVEPNEDCYAALELIKEGWDESHGALYFERTSKKETWHSRNLEKLFIHGNHTFYTEVCSE